MSEYNKLNQKLSRIALIGNYLPRKCGIATFTTDTYHALADEIKNGGEIAVVAINDIPEGYFYPEEVKFTIRENQQTDYYWAADYLNVNNYEIAILEHEFGIFGGNNGSYILHMIKNLKMPVIVNLHTVLEQPNPDQNMVMNEILKNADCVTVMSHRAIEILNKNYLMEGTPIRHIPHGIPVGPFSNPGLHNQALELHDKQILLSFGLLGPGKGLKQIIQALPDVVKRHPAATLVILGQTHPNILRESGEAYRNTLIQLARRLGVQQNVIFHNKFVSSGILEKYLQTATLYVMAYPNKEQTTSGTLSFAFGAGCCIVSTPFWHAEELLADGRGCLCPFNDPEAMTKAIVRLLDSPEENKTMRLLAYQHSRRMTYKEVAGSLLNLAMEIRQVPKPKVREKESIKSITQILTKLPAISLSHFKNLTDNTGIFQHAHGTIPNLHHGYCTDDNARALIFACVYSSLHKTLELVPFIQTYMAFLFYAYNPETMRFRNFMSYDRRWLEIVGSEDSHARAVWALGITIKYAPNKNIREAALRLFLIALAVVADFSSCRSVSFVILGIDSYLYTYSGDEVARKIRNDLALRLYTMFKKNATDNWPWPEDSLTYANAKLPHALIAAGEWIPDQGMLEMGKRALEWLIKIQTAPEGHLSIIGNQGWYKKEQEKVKYDQQPIEAMSLVDACTHLYWATKDKKWLDEAEKSIAWFLGRNDNNIQIYDFETGGCGDGLLVDSVSTNQGAESTLSWLIAIVRMYEIMGMSGMSLSNPDKKI